MSNLQLTCPECGVFNKINDTKCWKCKRSISEEEKQKFLNDLPSEKKEQYLAEEEQQPKTLQNKTHRNSSVDSGDYGASILIARFVSAVGWATCLVAIVIVFSAFAATEKVSAVAIAPGLGALIGGLILVVVGQSFRAVMDNANYTRLILKEIRKKS